MDLSEYFKKIESEHKKEDTFAVYIDSEGEFRQVSEDSAIKVAFTLAERIFHDEPADAEIEYIIKSDKGAVSGIYKNMPFPESIKATENLVRTVLE